MYLSYKTSDRAEAIGFFKWCLIMPVAFGVIIYLLVEMKVRNFGWDLMMLPMIGFLAPFLPVCFYWFINREYEVVITDKEFRYFDGKSWVAVNLSDIQEIEVPYGDGYKYYFKTKQGPCYSIPCLYDLIDQDVIDMVCELNPSINKEKFYRHSGGTGGIGLRKWGRKQRMMQNPKFHYEE